MARQSKIHVMSGYTLLCSRFGKITRNLMETEKIPFLVDTLEGSFPAMNTEWVYNFSRDTCPMCSDITSCIYTIFKAIACCL